MKVKTEIKYIVITKDVNYTNFQSGERLKSTSLSMEKDSAFKSIKRWKNESVQI